MGNLGINVTLLAGCESRGNRYNYKVYVKHKITFSSSSFRH